GIEIAGGRIDELASEADRLALYLAAACSVANLTGRTSRRCDQHQLTRLEAVRLILPQARAVAALHQTRTHEPCDFRPTCTGNILRQGESKSSDLFARDE